MAELILKVGPGAGYEDGDVLCAFNRRRIRCCHAEHLCHVRRAAKTRDGLLPANALPRWFREHTHQYRFERVSRLEIERVEILTDTRELLGPETIDVPLFVQRRLRHARHAIFGLSGREFWYGGLIDMSDARLDLVWAKVTELSGRLESEPEFSRIDVGREALRVHLPIGVDDFSDAAAVDLESPQLALDRDGVPIWELREDDGRGGTKTTTVASEEPPDERPWQRKVAAKRQRRIRIDDTLGLTTGEITQVRDRSQEFDLRSRVYTRTAIIESKEAPRA